MLNVEQSRFVYNGDGVSTTFPYKGRLDDKTELLVYVDETLKTLYNDYDITGTLGGTEFSVVFATAPIAGTNNVAFDRDTPVRQERKFSTTAVERAFDYVVKVGQNLKNTLTRTLRLAPWDHSTMGYLPLLEDRVLMNLSFDADGNPIATPMFSDVNINDTMIAASAAQIRGLTAVNYSGTFVYLGSHQNGKISGGGVYFLDYGDSTSADDGGMVLVDASGRRWKKADGDDRAIPLATFGAVGDGVTDDTAAIQKAFDYAQLVCTDAGYRQSRRVTFVGGGKCYAVSDRLNISSCSITLTGAQFKALASANWNDSNSMLKVQGEDHYFANLDFDCNMVANGIEHSGSAMYVDINIEAFGLNDNRYGLGSFSGNPVYALRVSSTGVPRSVSTDQADRKGICFKLIDNGDSKFVMCVGAYARTCLLNQDVANNKFTECHFFNGNGDSLLPPHVDSIIVENVRATAIFNGCYFDNGYVDLYDQDAIINGCFFLYASSKTTLAAKIRLWASKTNDTLDRLHIGKNFYTDNTIPVFQFKTSGANTWDASVNQTHMTVPKRDVDTAHGETTLISSNSANQNVLKLVSNAIKARFRLADKNTTLNAEPCLETSGDNLYIGLANGSLFARMSSAGKWLFGPLVTAAGFTSNASSFEVDDGIRIEGSGGKTDPKSLDAYQEGTFTPVLTFFTPGNLAVTYATQVGRYTRIGNRVLYELEIETSAFTHTTASGGLRVTGLPFTALSASIARAGACSMQGWTKAGYSQISAIVAGNSTLMTFEAAGSGVALSSLVVADVPTAGTVKIKVSGHYEIAT
jgi:hypothetical protein